MNKYKIGDEVLIYNKGKLVKRSISRIQIIISPAPTDPVTEDIQIFYRFLGDTGLFLDSYIDEKEVFESLDQFIEINQSVASR